MRYLQILLTLSIVFGLSTPHASAGAHEQDDLVLAIKEQNIDGIRQIISNPQSLANINFASLNTYGVFQGTALSLAVSVGNVRVVKEVLRGIKVQSQTNKENTDAQVNRPDSNGKTPLNLASANGDLDIVVALLENGARVNQLSQDGWTSINLAAENGRLDVIQTLVSRGGNLETPIQNGDTALHLAAAMGHLDVVQFLVKKQLPVSQSNQTGRTPLHLAAMNGRTEAVRTLIEAGAGIDQPSADGLTPLHFAVSNGKLDTVRTLVEKRADLNRRDSAGRTPLFLSMIKGLSEISQFLLESEGLNIVQEFAIAFEQGRSEVVKQYIRILNNREYSNTAECSRVLTAYQFHSTLLELHQINGQFKCTPCSEGAGESAAYLPQAEAVCVR